MNKVTYTEESIRYPFHADLFNLQGMEQTETDCILLNKLTTSCGKVEWIPVHMN